MALQQRQTLEWFPSIFPPRSVDNSTTGNNLSTPTPQLANIPADLGTNTMTVIVDQNKQIVWRGVGENSQQEAFAQFGAQGNNNLVALTGNVSGNEFIVSRAATVQTENGQAVRHRVRFSPADAQRFDITNNRIDFTTDDNSQALQTLREDPGLRAGNRSISVNHSPGFEHTVVLNARNEIVYSGSSNSGEPMVRLAENLDEPYRIVTGAIDPNDATRFNVTTYGVTTPVQNGTSSVLSSITEGYSGPPLTLPVNSSGYLDFSQPGTQQALQAIERTLSPSTPSEMRNNEVSQSGLGQFSAPAGIPVVPGERAIT